MSHTAYARILPPSYRDGIHLPRVASNGNPLPLARELSTTFLYDQNNQDSASLSVMHWAQFVAHDFSLTPSTETGGVRCCDDPDNAPEDICIHVVIPEDDPFYSQFNVTCLSSIRNAHTLTGNCTGGPAQQINSLTHMIDGSHIYGSDDDVASSLREFQGGRLLAQTTGDGRTFPPNVEDATVACDTTDAQDACFRAGDVRVNQNPQLTALHTLFLREHNRIAGELDKLGLGWNDEQLYQEARRIVIAEIQHITYNHWMPEYLGTEYVRQRNLYSLESGFSLDYDSNITLMTINSFASAAYRSGHSGIQGILDLYNYDMQTVGNLTLSDWFLKPRVVQEANNLDELILGQINQPMQKLDNYRTVQLSQFLFRRGRPYGSDLSSFDVQRGRDHGIPPYVDFVEVCLGYRPNNFSALAPLIKTEFIQALEGFYPTVADIDLFIGGSLENLADGARIGSTFQCIIGEQYYRYKFGDRFWYEIGGTPQSFTENQLNNLRNATLSKIICNNGDNINKITRNVFLPSSSSNAVVNCAEIPDVDFRLWVSSS